MSEQKQRAWEDPNNWGRSPMSDNALRMQQAADEASDAARQESADVLSEAFKQIADLQRLVADTQKLLVTDD
jgi:hypothetical protein